MARRLVIRADATPGIGAGHISRMIALGQAWLRKGGSVVFVACITAPELCKRIRDEGFGLIELSASYPDPVDLSAMKGIVRETDRVALDGYHFDTAYQQVLRAMGCETLVMDDVNDRGRYSASILVNPNAGAENYAYDTDGDTLVLRGARYALLRQEFLAASCPGSKAVSPARRVLVTYGGADSSNMAGQALEALSRCFIDGLHVRVVLGPVCEHRERLQAQVLALPFRCETLWAVEDMSSIMRWADIAIGAAGSTCWELCHLGVPMVVSAVVDNQQGVAAALRSHGAAVVVDSLDGETLGKIMIDPDALQAMSLAGQKLVDGFGAERIVSAFEWADLHFRPVCFEDWELLLQWRNASEVRRYSLNTQRIDSEEHRAWLRKRLADGGGLFFIAESNETPVGQIRFDRVEDKMQVSLNVAPGMSGRGIGSAMLGNACGRVFALHPEVTVVARVKEDNVASNTMFCKAGFVLEGAQECPEGRIHTYSLRGRHAR